MNEPYRPYIPPVTPEGPDFNLNVVIGVCNLYRARVLNARQDGKVIYIDFDPEDHVRLVEERDGVWAFLKLDEFNEDWQLQSLNTHRDVVEAMVAILSDKVYG